MVEGLSKLLVWLWSDVFPSAIIVHSYFQKYISKSPLANFDQILCKASSDRGKGGHKNTFQEYHQVVKQFHSRMSDLSLCEDNKSPLAGNIFVS